MSTGWNGQDGDHEVEPAISSPAESPVSSPMHKRLRAAVGGEAQEAEGIVAEEDSSDSALTVEYSPGGASKVRGESCPAQVEALVETAALNNLPQLNLRQQAQQWWKIGLHESVLP